MILLFLFILIISAIVLIWFALYGTKTVSLNLPKEEQFQPLKVQSGIPTPFSLIRVMLEKLRLKDGLARKIDSAHIKSTPENLFFFKLVMAAGVTIVAYVFMGKADPLMLIGTAIGFIIPDLVLNQKIAKRKYAIVRILPETVDLLGLCVEAGLDFAAAVKWVIEKTPSNPLIEEFSLLLDHIRWGKSRSQALKDMSRRVDIPEISSFVQTLVQAERMGTPVNEAFTILSEDTRMFRFHRGERMAMQAPIKILIPLIFCILPVIAIVIAGPIFLQFSKGALLKSL